MGVIGGMTMKKKYGRPIKDLSGKKFNSLTVIKDSGKRAPGGNVYWLCKCICGKEKAVLDRNFKSGNVKSCGCLRSEIYSRNAKKRFTIHGHASNLKHSPVYSTWHAMWQRCINPQSRGYHWYGAKGVKICKRWESFKNFLKDMGERPVGKTIDRINPFGDYKPSNCKWSTHKEQMNNRRDNWEGIKS